MARLEFFFDCSSPWTYLGFEGIQPIADELGVAIEWRPILVGGVFNTVNPSVYASRENPVPAKHAYMLKDLADWARAYELDIRFPPSIFPVNSVRAMRGCFVAFDQGKLVPYAREVFRIYWSEDRDIADPEVLREVCARAGLDADDLIARINEDGCKQRLRDTTEELIERGGFGTPTIFVNDRDMYFGNDRLELVRLALIRDEA